MDDDTKLQFAEIYTKEFPGKKPGHASIPPDLTLGEYRCSQASRNEA